MVRSRVVFWSIPKPAPNNERPAEQREALQREGDHPERGAEEAGDK